MKSVVKKSGNSAAVRIPPVVMEAIPLKLDEPVEVRERRKGKVSAEESAEVRAKVHALIG
jgi:antitoxin component of MazEF toxin-antitoxin module